MVRILAVWQHHFCYSTPHSLNVHNINPGVQGRRAVANQASQSVELLQSRDLRFTPDLHLKFL